jgi:UDP-2,4-diacetamido-2,4,6-trideoxy-beta-L-altropyranose hydrolase
MHLAFRCDANTSLGAGHLRRCAVLAEEAHEQGNKVSFLVRTDGNPVWEASLPPFAETTLVRNATSDPLGELLAWTQKAKPDFLVVDHYQLVGDHAGHIARSGTRWLMFDSARSSERISATLVHNALPGVSERDYRARMNFRETRLLAGPAYALLPRAIHGVQRKSFERRNLAILFGGGSDRGMILRTLRSLRGELPEWQRIVFATSANDSLDEIRRWIIENGVGNVTLRVNEQRIWERLAECDLAVSACGISVNELACLGIPALCVAIADNQIPVGERWTQTGGMQYLGEAGALSDESIPVAVRMLAEDATLRARMSETARRLVDGCGARRTVAAIQEVCDAFAA